MNLKDILRKRKEQKRKAELDQTKKELIAQMINELRYKAQSREETKKELIAQMINELRYKAQSREKI